MDPTIFQVTKDYYGNDIDPVDVYISNSYSAEAFEAVIKKGHVRLSPFGSGIVLMNDDQPWSASVSSYLYGLGHIMRTWPTGHFGDNPLMDYTLDAYAPQDDYPYVDVKDRQLTILADEWSMTTTVYEDQPVDDSNGSFGDVEFDIGPDVVYVEFDEIAAVGGPGEVAALIALVRGKCDE